MRASNDQVETLEAWGLRARRELLGMWILAHAVRTLVVVEGLWLGKIWLALLVLMQQLWRVLPCTVNDIMSTIGRPLRFRFLRIIEHLLRTAILELLAAPWLLLTGGPAFVQWIWPDSHKFPWAKMSDFRAHLAPTTLVLVASRANSPGATDAVLMLGTVAAYFFLVALPTAVPLSLTREGAAEAAFVRRFAALEKTSNAVGTCAAVAACAHLEASWLSLAYVLATGFVCVCTDRTLALPGSWITVPAWAFASWYEALQLFWSDGGGRAVTASQSKAGREQLGHQAWHFLQQGSDEPRRRGLRETDSQLRVRMLNRAAARDIVRPSPEDKAFDMFKMACPANLVRMYDETIELWKVVKKDALARDKSLAMDVLLDRTRGTSPHSPLPSTKCAQRYRTVFPLLALLYCATKGQARGSRAIDGVVFWVGLQVLCVSAGRLWTRRTSKLLDGVVWYEASQALEPETLLYARSAYHQVQRSDHVFAALSLPACVTDLASEYDEPASASAQNEKED